MIDLNPLGWGKRRRRARALAARRARMAEDRAWALREDEAALAHRLSWAKVHVWEPDEENSLVAMDVTHRRVTRGLDLHEVRA